VRIFIAGATGMLGVRLVPLLVADGHMVAGMTRSPGKAGLLRGLGAEPVVCDVFDRDALTQALAGFGPEVVLYQLTDLPDEAADLALFSDRNDRMRGEGTRNLLAAAAAARPGRVIAQSIAWELPSEHRRAVTAAHERAVLHAGGVVIRYSQLYGPGTFYPAAPPEPPRIHVDAAARQTLPALGVPPGVTTGQLNRAHHARRAHTRTMARPWPWPWPPPSPWSATSPRSSTSADRPDSAALLQAQPPSRGAGT
jgi:nucleoside-diphosphate-sugar epimerase